jgi:hypothetical protein
MSLVFTIHGSSSVSKSSEYAHPVLSTHTQAIHHRDQCSKAPGHIMDTAEQSSGSTGSHSKAIHSNPAARIKIILCPALPLRLV